MKTMLVPIYLNHIYIASSAITYFLLLKYLQKYGKHLATERLVRVREGYVLERIRF